MAARDSLVNKCEDFIANMIEQYGLDGIILFVNKHEDDIADVFQNGHPLVNLEMTRRFVLINDSESLAMQISAALTDGDDESDDDGA